MIKPLVASNLATRYEVIAITTIDSVTVFASQPLTFVASDLMAGSFTRLCGNSIIVSLDLTSAGSNTSSSNYFISIEFSSDFSDDLGSNLDVSTSS